MPRESLVLKGHKSRALYRYIQMSPGSNSRQRAYVSWEHGLGENFDKFIRSSDKIIDLPSPNQTINRITGPSTTWGPDPQLQSGYVNLKPHQSGQANGKLVRLEDKSGATAEVGQFATVPRLLSHIASGIQQFELSIDRQLTTLCARLPFEVRNAPS